MTTPSLLTVAEVAQILRKGTGFVYSEIHQRRLPAKRYGRSYGIRPEDLDAYMLPDQTPVIPRTTRDHIKQLMRAS